MFLKESNMPPSPPMSKRVRHKQTKRKEGKKENKKEKERKPILLFKKLVLFGGTKALQL
jgi:hypothetical protein